MATATTGRAAGTVNSAPPDRLLNEHQAAERLGVSVKTLRRWRWSKRLLPWVKVGSAVRYEPQEVDALIAAGRQTIRQQPNP